VEKIMIKDNNVITLIVFNTCKTSRHFKN